ncbi:MAG: NUDIX hydrolase [Gammaproteobacteria bacterium]
MSNQYGTTPTGPGEYRGPDVGLVKPKEAATLVVVRDGEQPTILMGKRASTHRFMPNKFVFPGGRLDLIDQRLKTSGDLNPHVLERLRKSTRKDITDRKLRGLALAAIRETYEETGLVIGRATNQKSNTRHAIWHKYFEHGVEPPLEDMDFFARAITPAYRTRRFDTRFFMIHEEFIHNDPALVSKASGELNQIHWLTFDEARELDLPAVTRWAIDLVEQRITLSRAQQVKEPAPFVRFNRGRSISVDL